MAEKPRGKRPQETIELTEVLILHGDSLEGTDQQKEQKLERIREGLRQHEIDFIDQPDAFEIWVNTGQQAEVLAVLEQVGFRPDVYEV